MKNKNKKIKEQADNLIAWIQDYIQQKTSLKKENNDYHLLLDKTKEVGETDSHHAKMIFFLRIHPKYKHNFNHIIKSLKHVTEDYYQYQKNAVSSVFFPHVHISLSIELGEFVKINTPLEQPESSTRSRSPSIEIEDDSLQHQYKVHMIDAKALYKNSKYIEYVAEKLFSELLKKASTLDEVASLVRAAREDIDDKNKLLIPAREKTFAIVKNLLSGSQHTKTLFIELWHSKWESHSLFAEHRNQHLWQGAFGNTGIQRKVKNLIKNHQ